MKLLGLAGRSTWQSRKAGRVSKVSRDTIERISYLLGIQGDQRSAVRQGAGGCVDARS